MDPQPSTSTTFDPYAITPAFARASSSHTDAPPLSSQLQPSTSSSSTAISTSVDAPQMRQRVLAALTDASLMGELPTTDPLSILLQKHLPPHIRPPRDLSGSWNVPAPTSVPSQEIPDPFSTDTAAPPAAAETIDVDSVRSAAALNSWRKIASLARIKVEQYAAPPLVETGADALEQVLQWWVVRLYALTRLKLYSLLRTELSSVWAVLEGEEVDVPFALRVLTATESKFRGEVKGALEQYVGLIRLCKRRMRESEGKEEKEEWRRRAERVGLMLVFTLVEVKDYAGAVEVVTPLVERCFTDVGRAVEERAHLVDVCSRVWMQAGDFETGLSLLDRASALLPPSSPLHAQIAHSRSLITTITSTSSTFSSNTPTAHLNTAIASFYNAHLDSAIVQLEQAMQADPRSTAAADAVVFNLVTLYELGRGAEAEVVERKREVLASVARWAGEPGVGASSFKL